MGTSASRTLFILSGTIFTVLVSSLLIPSIKDLYIKADVTAHFFYMLTATLLFITTTASGAIWAAAGISGINRPKVIEGYLWISLWSLIIGWGLGGLIVLAMTMLFKTTPFIIPALISAVVQLASITFFNLKNI